MTVIFISGVVSSLHDHVICNKTKLFKLDVILTYTCSNPWKCDVSLILVRLV